MHAIEILEIQDPAPFQNQLTILFNDCIESGASIGFLAPSQPHEVADYLEQLNKQVLNNQKKLFIAIQNKQVVGSVQLSLTEKKNGQHRAEVEKLMVMSSYRKQGIATLLLKTLETCAIDLNVQLLILDTRLGDVSEQLYLKQGFTPAGVIPHFALSSDGQYSATAIYYKIIDSAIIAS